jgi:hypothetical protein
MTPISCNLKSISQAKQCRNVSEHGSSVYPSQKIAIPINVNRLQSPLLIQTITKYGGGTFLTPPPIFIISFNRFESAGNIDYLHPSNTAQTPILTQL